MTTRAWRILGLVSLAAPVLVGQQGGVAGPVAGYVFDRSARALGPILGIPCARTTAGVAQTRAIPSAIRRYRTGGQDRRAPLGLFHRGADESLFVTMHLLSTRRWHGTCLGDASMRRIASHAGFLAGAIVPVTS